MILRSYTKLWSIVAKVMRVSIVGRCTSGLANDQRWLLTIGNDRQRSLLTPLFPAILSRLGEVPLGIQSLMRSPIPESSTPSWRERAHVPSWARDGIERLLVQVQFASLPVLFFFRGLRGTSGELGSRNAHPHGADLGSV